LGAIFNYFYDFFSILLYQNGKSSPAKQNYLGISTNEAKLQKKQREAPTLAADKCQLIFK